MARRRLEDRGTRKINKIASSYYITLPVEMIRDLGWQEKQKVTVEQKGKTIVIKDWKK